nr:RNA-directed DNA polymerase, eukaryota, reverse transcriptase zinc-binding domain protein [Tanacetum cinerariifolium]
MGVGVPHNIVLKVADLIRCTVMRSSFCYLGVMVGECMSRRSAWASMVHKLQFRLSKSKVKTFSIGGRLTLLKSILGASSLYNLSIFKVPKGILKDMESIRSHFFNGADSSDRKITWVAWDNVLASKNEGLGVLSFHALNRALLLKWVWRFISRDESLWFKVIQALYGPSFDLHARVGDGLRTRFWNDLWISDGLLSDRFPRLFALEMDKEVLVAVKLGASSVADSFRQGRSTRWVKFIPIKVNVFAWRARRDRLSTRLNLSRRGVVLDSILCPLCDADVEDVHHVMFRCDMALSVLHKICWWWELDWQVLSSFSV